MADTRDRRRSRAQTFALAFGIVFLLVGIAGFIPGITTNYDDMGFAGDKSDPELLGLFQVSVLHNIVHLLFGVAGIAMARRWESAQRYLAVSGVLYAVLFVYGLFVGGGGQNEGYRNFVPVNNEDDILHLALAAGLLGAWALSRRERVHVDERHLVTAR